MLQVQAILGIKLHGALGFADYEAMYCADMSGGWGSEKGLHVSQVAMFATVHARVARGLFLALSFLRRCSIPLYGLLPGSFLFLSLLSRFLKIAFLRLILLVVSSAPVIVPARPIISATSADDWASVFFSHSTVCIGTAPLLG